MLNARDCHNHDELCERLVFKCSQLPAVVGDLWYCMLFYVSAMQSLKVKKKKCVLNTIPVTL